MWIEPTTLRDNLNTANHVFKEGWRFDVGRPGVPWIELRVRSHQLIPAVITLQERRERNGGRVRENRKLLHKENTYIHVFDREICMYSIVEVTYFTSGMWEWINLYMGQQNEQT